MASDSRWATAWFVHPAGHILGSRRSVSRRGGVWVVTGDYKATGPELRALRTGLLRCW
jgi:hypothetical protein